LWLGGGAALAADAGGEAKIYDVREFGAKGDGKTFDTAAIQKALDECGRAGGGMVRLTAGTYLCQPVFLRSKTALQLDAGAVLQGTDTPGDYLDTNRAGRAMLSLVNGRGLTGVSITGKGKIDGKGARWWEPVRAAKRTGEPEPGPRPRLVTLSACQDVRIEGVTLANSPSFHLVPSDCENVVIEGVTILAPADSPNTDAIDPSACRHVRITKCVLDVGDDNIAIKSGRQNPAHPDAACEDIVVTDCTMRHGHGMSIGSETVGGVRDVTVRRCTFEDTDNGIRIKSERGRGGLVENISYSDLTMKNVKVPILISAYYPKIPREDEAVAVTSTTPRYREIRITNVTADSPAGAGIIIGLPECEVENVVLENVHLTAPVGLTIRNAKGIILKNTKIEVEHGEAVMVENAEVKK
jgi:polygalacturonase